MSTNDPNDPGALPEGDRANLIRQRALLAYALSEQHNGKRDYYQIFGWNRDPDVADYYASYLRNPYAKAVVNKPADTAWRDPPEIVDNADTDGETTTQFEADVAAFVDAADPWHYCKRADKLQGIGQFGVLLIGWADGEDRFARPVDRTALDRNDPDEAVSWFRPLSQLSVEEIRYGDSGSGRWGLPEYYKVDLADENDATTSGVFGDGEAEQWFHHERVLHLAEGLLDDEVRGTPRQQSCFNVLTDIQKTLGSAAETAYSNARPGLNLNVDKDYQLEDGGTSQQEELERYVHDQQPFIRTQGTEVNRIAGETVDPTPITDTQIAALATDSGIPVSVLRGKEVADRAKSEDLQQYYGVIGERREQFLDPRVVRELIARGVAFNAFTAPENGPRGFATEWPPLEEESAQDEADVYLARSQTAKNLQSLMPAYGTAEWREVVEEGTFPDPPDDAGMDIDPADVADLQRRVDEAERQAPPGQGPTDAPGTQQPAVTDGGEDADE